jgi:hypothetical protein
MIRSRHRTFGFWLFFLATGLFGCLLLSALSQYYLGKTIIKMQIRSEFEFFIQAGLGLAGVILFLGILLQNVNNITIDVCSHRIRFQNILTGRVRKYKFTDFDGYIDTFIEHDQMGIKYETIRFIKNKRVVRRIDSYFYSNYDELRAALIDCTYLGEFRFGLWKRLKMILHLPVLD